MIKYISIMMFIVFAAGCKKDEGACTKDQFIGVWKGDVACNISGNNQNVSVEINAGSGDKVIVTDSVPGNLVTYLTDVELKQSGCLLSGDNKILGSGSEFGASLTDDGQKLILEFRTTILGVEAERCKYTLSPK